MLKLGAGVLSDRNAFKWLFDRRPIDVLDADSLERSVGFRVTLSRATNEPPQPAPTTSVGTSLGDQYLEGSNFLITPLIHDKDIALGAFFGDNRPPYPGGYAAAVCSRWAADLRNNILVQFMWFHDGSLFACTYAFRSDGDWAKEFVLFDPFPEGTPPVKAKFRARFVDVRDCENCVMTNCLCTCRELPLHLDEVFDLPLTNFQGGSVSGVGFAGNFVASRSSNFISVGDLYLEGPHKPTRRIYARNEGARFSELENIMNRRMQLFAAGYAMCDPGQDARHLSSNPHLPPPERSRVVHDSSGSDTSQDSHSGH